MHPDSKRFFLCSICLCLCLCLCLVLASCVPNPTVDHAEPGSIPAREAGDVHRSVSQSPRLFAFNFEPHHISSSAIANVAYRLGATLSADGERRFGFSTQICLHRQPTEKTVEYLRAALAAATENDVPVIVRLMANRYWENRPDLWNWWAPDEPGYNPENINNVEWYGWSRDKATKMSWVKWGPGAFIPLPPNPNLASPGFIAANRKELDALLPILMGWYRGLPEDRKYLFGGLVFGWELQADHVGSFYEGHEDGDIFQWRRKTNDERPLQMGKSLQLGFAAAAMLGLQDGQGEMLDDLSVAAIMRHYFQRMVDIAVEYEVPEQKITLHGVGYGLKNHGSILSPETDVIPGWTTYNAQPVNFEYLIDSRGDRPWSAIEFGGPVNPERIEHYFRRNCLCVNLYSRNAHLRSENIRAVRQFLGVSVTGDDPLPLPYENGFEISLAGWFGSVAQMPAARSNAVAFEGEWSLHAGSNQASDLILFEKPRPAVVEFQLLDSEGSARKGVVDFRGDGEANLRLGTFQAGYWNYRKSGSGDYEDGPKRRDGWRHVRAVFDGEQARLYMDGELIATDPGLGKIRELSVGWYWHNSAGFEWDEFRVTEYRGEE